MGRDKSRLRFGGRTLLSHIKRAAESTGLPVRVIRRDIVPRCGPLGGVYTALTRTKMDHVLFLPCDMPLMSEALIRWVLKNTQAPGDYSSKRRTTRSAGFQPAVSHGFQPACLADSEIVRSGSDAQPIGNRRYSRLETCATSDLGHPSQPSVPLLTRNAFVVTAEGPGFPFVLDRAALPIVAAQIKRRRFSLRYLAKALGAAALWPPPRLRKLLQNVNTPEDWTRLVAIRSAQKR